MLNKDQLLKIKGILSAKEGTQVPKFLNAGNITLNNPGFSPFGGGDSYRDFLNWLKIPGNENKTYADYEKEKSAFGGTNLATGTLTPGVIQTPALQKTLLEQTAPAATSTITAAQTEGEKEKEKEKEEEPTKAQKLLEGIDKTVSAFSTNFLGADQQAAAITPPTEKDLNTGGGSDGGSLGETTEKLQLDLQKLKVQKGTAGEDDPPERKSGVQMTQWGVKKPRNEKGEKVKWGDMTKEEKGQYIEAIGQKGGLYAEVAGSAIDTASSMLVDKSDYAEDSWTNSEGRGLYDQASNSLMSMGGYGAMAGAAMKVVGLINDLGGSKSIDFSKDEATINLVGGSYGGTVSDINDAASKAGKKYGLFEAGARHDANKQIREARRKLNTMAGIASTAKEQSEAARNMSYQNTLNYQYQINGGYDLRYMRAAKEGGNIIYFKDPFKVSLSDINEFKVELSDTPTLFKAGGTLLDKLDKDVFKVVLTDVPELSSFKQGGTIKDREIEVIETDTTLKSVIPEGVLHKNKHHLDKVGVDDSELTKKGIPVVDNQGELQAEIELNEIIFTLEVTKELESRYKEFYEEGTSSTKKDELAIEAGKLLWKEILYNTDDRTGLIDTLKLGGTLKLPKPSEVSKHKQGGTINNIDLDEITKMVKQALINILTHND